MIQAGQDERTAGNPAVLLYDHLGVPGSERGDAQESLLSACL